MGTLWKRVKTVSDRIQYILRKASHNQCVYFGAALALESIDTCNFNDFRQVCAAWVLLEEMKIV